MLCDRPICAVDAICDGGVAPTREELEGFNSKLLLVVVFAREAREFEGAPLLAEAAVSSHNASSAGRVGYICSRDLCGERG